MFNMKRMLVGLAAFTVVLALSNLATAFAAASLAKDTSVSQASGTGAPTLTDKEGHDLATLSKGITFEANTIEMTYKPQNDAERALFEDYNNTVANTTTSSSTFEDTDTENERHPFTGFTFLSNLISQDKAESIFQSCQSSTPATITHMCDGAQTITAVGCNYASRVDGRFYYFGDGVKILCGLYSDNTRGSDPMGDRCAVLGLQCSNYNRIPTAVCGADKPDHPLNFTTLQETSKCNGSCECANDCCVSFTEPVCMHRDNKPNEASCF